MDRVGLKELIKAGVRLCSDRWEKRNEHEKSGVPDSRVSTVLDRLTQVGVISLEHKLQWLWQGVLDGLGEVFSLGVPEERTFGQPDEIQARWMVEVIHRVSLLGAVANLRLQYPDIRELVLRKVGEGRRSSSWLRYAVTMAARGRLEGAFKGKSLIGPVSEYVRERPQFFGVFNRNLDHVVDNLCQFDFVACVVAILDTQNMSDCYPNFGGYYSHRTLPVVRSLVRGEAARTALPAVSDQQLAEVLQQLSQFTAQLFVEVAGWDGYDESINIFIERNAPANTIGG